MDIFKNPIVIGLTMGTLAYCYLLYTVNERNEENEKKKKSRRKDKESVNIMIPLVITIIAWFVAYAYFEYNSENSIKSVLSDDGIQQNIRGGGLPLPLGLSPKFGFINDVISETSEPQQFSLLNGGVTVPDKLPDILLDVR